MIHGSDGVAELVWESGQPLARHPSRSHRFRNSSCPSLLDKLDTKYQDRKRPRLEQDNYGTSLEPMWVEPHVVPDYKDLDHSGAFNDELVAKVPDHHQQLPRPSHATLFHEFNTGWGPFGQMLMDNGNRRQQQEREQRYPYNELNGPQEPTHLSRPSRLLKVGGASQGTYSCSTNSTNGPNSSSRLDLFMQRQQKNSRALADGSSSIPVESTLVESGSKSVKALETRFDLLATGGDTAKAVSPPPDELSEAVSRDDHTRAKRARTEVNAAATGQDEDPDDHRKESVCSLAASDFERLKKRHHEDTTRMAQRGKKKKRRSAEVHSLSEKRRRAKINKKLQVLQDMIPNANKVDKASLLDEAIEYMKGLQLQLQIMAMGRGLMMHPMMLPGFQAPQMAQPPPPMGMGMNTTAMGLGCTPNPLSNPMLLRFPEQMLPLSMPQLQPFSPMPTGGSSSKPSIPMPSVELQGYAPPFVGVRNAAQGTNPEMLNIDDRKDG